MTYDVERLKGWLTASEELELHLVEGGIKTARQILLVTTKRAVLLEHRLGNRIRDKSDKLWRQLVDVHQVEGFFSASLVLRFFRYDESISLHNPHNLNHPPAESTWILGQLSKSEANRAYSLLKAREEQWKDIRRVEQLERDKATGGRYLRVEPPPRDDNET